MDELINDVYENIKKEISNSEYILFGHSMGSVICYELYYKILNSNNRLPLHIIFSGRLPPHINKSDKSLHNMELEDLKAELLKLGGTSPEIFNYKELVDLYLPIIRNDFKILHEYSFIRNDKKIKCNASVMYGEQEDVLPSEMNEWQFHINGFCTFYKFKGDHFFINQEEENVVKIINKIALSELNGIIKRIEKL